jgi:hypothetical protein
MARRMRCQDAGYVYHVLNRAVGRATIFKKPMELLGQIKTNLTPFFRGSAESPRRAEADIVDLVQRLIPVTVGRP